MDLIQAPGALDGVIAEYAPILLTLVILAALQVLFIRKGGPSRKFRRWPARSKAAPPFRAAVRPDVADPASQMNFISKVGFETRPLLNREEYPVLLLLEEVVREIGSGFRVMAQTSLGEVIRPSKSAGSREDRDLAFRSINSKRLDFSIFDRFGRLVLAVEYQGSGHYHDTSFIRDAVKKEALRKAGVTLLEVPVRFSAEEVKRQVRQLVVTPAIRQSIPRSAPNSTQASHATLADCDSRPPSSSTGSTGRSPADPGDAPLKPRA